MDFKAFLRNYIFPTVITCKHFKSQILTRKTRQYSLLETRDTFEKREDLFRVSFLEGLAWAPLISAVRNIDRLSGITGLLNFIGL